MPAWEAEALRMVPQIFGVTEAHVIEAPRYCGDGIDGACAAGDCLIVRFVEIQAKRLAAAYAAGQGSTNAYQAGEMDGYAAGQQAAADHVYDKASHVCGYSYCCEDCLRHSIAAALRATGGAALLGSANTTNIPPLHEHHSRCPWWCGRDPATGEPRPGATGGGT